MEFFTIGVYNSTEEDFFNKLIENKIDTFCDIRRRRGVRGAKYVFVNSLRLQARLKELGIEYLHILDLAPTNEIRDLQNQADKENKEKKRDRNTLGKVFSIAYKDRVLSEFDFIAFIQDLEDRGAEKVVLFCVEENPEACHRSIVSNRLEKLNYKTHHL